MTLKLDINVTRTLSVVSLVVIVVLVLRIFRELNAVFNFRPAGSIVLFSVRRLRGVLLSSNMLTLRVLCLNMARRIMVIVLGCLLGCTLPF